MDPFEVWVVSPSVPVEKILQQPGSDVKTSPSKPLDHPGQVDERSSRSLIENSDETGHHQASSCGGLSRFPIVNDDLIRPKIFCQEDRFALAGVKVP